MLIFTNIRHGIVLLFFWIIAASASAQAPTFDRAFAFGNSNSSGGSDAKATVVDSQGNTYVTGTFGGTIRFGNLTLYSTGGSDVFVAKLDAAGNCIWAASGGGSNTDYGRGIGLDAAGNAYVTGIFSGSSARFGTTSIAATGPGLFDTYVAKLSPTGAWLWAVRGGGPGDDYAQAIAVDPTGNSYITGNFNGATISFGTTVLTNASTANGSDAFVAKLDAGGTWQWAARGGGTNSEGGESIVLDGLGNVYVTGSVSSLNSNFGNVSLVRTSQNLGLLVASLNSSGNWLWANSSGGNGGGSGYGI
uniref:SBBP repeat-containing protein n=1 Tax=uncultured Hymenobacter sp. TaxID=170016 RepID=UPI0035CB615C